MKFFIVFCMFAKIILNWLCLLIYKITDFHLANTKIKMYFLFILLIMSNLIANEGILSHTVLWKRRGEIPLRDSII